MKKIECLKYTLKGLEELNENSISGPALDWLHKGNGWEYKFNFVHFIQTDNLKLNAKKKYLFIQLWIFNIYIHIFKVIIQFNY